ncbi:flagellar protein FlaG [Paenibacillus sp. NEAU-GSW1]|uniref:flagellar protein FlaG n=1 Tax=Paenibacillus sp. NEAU-GSW1 TaxID=2682486 RepID=UPI0012E280EE|nr:flagellar protein FlaG [Paenibacillus sp. NEAU-GSW1]MUT65014.1 flagellar biosynthesis protein FlaG [Paenibacillus sp. NEAU-GSW1]
MNISSVNTTAGYTTEKNNNGPVKEAAPTVKANSEVKSNNGATANGVSASAQQHKKYVDKILQTIQEHDPATMVERSVHEGTNQIVYKVKNKETGELIREIPEEKLLDVAARFMELNGIIIDEKI